MEKELQKIREEVAEAIGLENYQGDKDMYLIRNNDGIVESGIDFSDEVDDVVSIFAKHLTEIEISVEKELEKQIL